MSPAREGGWTEWRGGAGWDGATELDGAPTARMPMRGEVGRHRGRKARPAELGHRSWEAGVQDWDLGVWGTRWRKMMCWKKKMGG